MAELSPFTLFHNVLRCFTPEITQRNFKPTFEMGIVIHTEGEDLDWEDRIFVKELQIYRDYVENIADEIKIQVVIPLGTFIYDVYDYLENIEITIKTKKQYFYSLGAFSKGKPILTTDRYKAVYLKDMNTAIPTNKDYAKEDLNQRLPIIATFQLIDRSVEAIRIKTVGGNFSESYPSTKTLIQNVFSRETNNILVDGRPPLDFIDIKQEDNSRLDAINIPSFTPLIGVPDYLQNKATGVYNAGLGCYIQKYAKDYSTFQKGFWVYPLYDPDRNNGVFDYFVYCPNTTAATNTYPAHMYDFNVLRIVAQKLTVIEDDKESSVMNEGSGFRVADASKMMNNPFTIHKKGPIFERSRLNTEVVYKERKDGVNYAVNKGTYFNNLAMTSEVMKRQATFATIELSNFDHDILAPGKVGRLIYYGTKGSSADKTLKKGTVVRNFIPHIAIITYSNNNQSPVTSMSRKLVDMTSNAVLKVQVGKIVDDPL